VYAVPHTLRWWQRPARIVSQKTFSRVVFHLSCLCSRFANMLIYKLARTHARTHAQERKLRKDYLRWQFSAWKSHLKSTTVICHGVRGSCCCFLFIALHPYPFLSSTVPLFNLLSSSTLLPACALAATVRGSVVARELATARTSQSHFK